MQRRIEVARAIRQPGEERSLRQCQVLGGLSEIDLGGGLNPGRVMAVIDAVQVQLQDVVLAVLGFEGRRQHGLAQLAHDRLLWGLQDGDLCQLFRNRAGALLRAAGDDIDNAGLDDPAPVDAVVLVEVLVLDGDRRVAEVGTDLVQLDGDDANALRVALFDQRAVTVDDLDVARRHVQAVGIGQGREGVGEGAQHQQQDQAEYDARDQHPVAPDLEPVEPILRPLRGSGRRCPHAWRRCRRRRARVRHGTALGWSRCALVYRFFETAACSRSCGLLAPLTSFRA